MLNASGRAESIDRFWRDIGDAEGLSSDGSSSEILAAALAMYQSSAAPLSNDTNSSEDSDAFSDKPDRETEPTDFLEPSLDLKDEEMKFGPDNTWGRKQLSLLGVDFYIEQRIDLNPILGVSEPHWPLELRKRIIRYSSLIFMC